MGTSSEADPERNRCPAARRKISSHARIVQDERTHLGVSISRGSFRSGIWAKRQSAALFELKAATDLAELFLRQGRMPEAYKHLSAALDRTPDGIVSPDHARALQILNQLQTRTRAVGQGGHLRSL